METEVTEETLSIGISRLAVDLLPRPPSPAAVPPTPATITLSPPLLLPVPPPPHRPFLKPHLSGSFSAILPGAFRSSASSSSAVGPTSAPSASSPASTLASLVRRAPGIKMTLVNQSGLPVELAAWPIAAEEGEVCASAAYKGGGIVRGSVGDPWQKKEGKSGELVELGVLKYAKPSSGFVGSSKSKSYGWVYFDILHARDDSDLLTRPYRIHGQAFVGHSPSGSVTAHFGRFDLDSSYSSPMPSGSFGRIEILRSDGSVDHLDPGKGGKVKESKKGRAQVVEVRYFVGKEVANVRNDELDDMGRKGALWRPSKNFVISSWVSCDGARVSLIIEDARYHEHHHHWSTRELRVSHHELTGVSFRPCFLLVSHGRETIFDRHWRIKPLDGSVIGAKMVSTVETPAFFEREKNLTLNYGFFDSGLGRAKQAYIYASHLHTSWLGDMLRDNPEYSQIPFGTLALAGSHDAGMLGRLDHRLLEFINRGKVDNDVPNVAKALPLLRFVLGLLKTFNVQADRILENLAMTQKDSIANQLEMGVRFFDIRPGYCLFDCVEGVPGNLHHQHAIVNGVRYDSFLVDILNFLGEHPREIVFFEIKSDGFAFLKDIPDLDAPRLAAHTMIPTTEALAAVLAEAQASASSSASREVKIGSAADLTKTVGELLASNTRLIIVDRVHDIEGERWDRGDSYSHEAYDTDEPEKVLAALKATHADASRRAATGDGPPATIYQLQATPTAQIWADVGASLTYSDASSLLVWSKAKMDRVTYPWIEQNEFVEPGNVVFLNDFVDGAIVELAVEKTRSRADAWLKKHHRASPNRS